MKQIAQNVRDGSGRAIAALAVLVLASGPLVRGAETNASAVRLARALSAGEIRCRVHVTLCVPVATRPDAARMASDLERSTVAAQFGAHAAALGYAAAGDISRAEHVLDRVADTLARVNLGRLYWSTGRDAEALRAWRDAGDPTWLARLLFHNIDPGSASAATDRLVDFALDEVGGTYDDHVLGGFVGLRFRRYLAATAHFQRALEQRPGDARVLMRLAEAYGAAPRERLSAADHAVIASHMAAAVRLDPGYADLHVLAAVSACLALGDYSAAAREADEARRLGFAKLPDDLLDGLARKCRAAQ